MRKDLILRGESGELRIPVCFNEAQHVEEFFSKMAHVVKMERLLKEKQTSAAAQLYGASIDMLYQLIFGADMTRAIKAFFGDDMFRMVTIVNPFILSHVLPAVRAASAKNMKRKRAAFVKGQKKAMVEASRAHTV